MSYIRFCTVLAGMALVAAMLNLSSTGQAFAAELLTLRFGPSANKTRIVFDLDGDTKWRVSGDEEGLGRLIVDFDTLSVGAEGLKDLPGEGHIALYRYAPSGRMSARFVLELRKTAKIDKAFMLPPSGEIKKHRLVIDLITADKKAFVASLPNPFQGLAAVIEDATSPAERAELSPEVKPKPAKRSVTIAAQHRPVVVIDAGHGGGDPGAHGQKGANEKDITLAAALELAELLKASQRYQVVLTRESDAKLALEKRSEIARKAKADLFISIHADANSNPDVHGSSVYTLSDKGTKRSAREALSKGDYQFFNIKIADKEPEVSGILFDLAQRDTMTESSKFSEFLIQNLSGVTPLLNNSHRTADYRVLLAPDVPAVLLELAFISNKKDEKNLTSAKWRNRSLTAVAGAIDLYFADPKTLARHAARQSMATN